MKIPKWQRRAYPCTFSMCYTHYMCVLVAQSCPTLVTPWTVAHQAPLSMGFSRLEYWSGLPFPSPTHTTWPKGNQSWIFIGGTNAEAEAPILWPPDAKSQMLGKTLMLGKTEGRRRRGWQRMRWLACNSMDRSLSKLQEMVKNRGAWHAAVRGVTNRHDWGTEQQHILHFGKHWSGLISHFKISTAVLSSEGRTTVGRDYCCWAEWGLRQQLCRVSSAAASLGRTSKDYD